MREKMIDILTSFYGVDPMYFGVEAQALADHLIANGVVISNLETTTESCDGYVSGCEHFKEQKKYYVVTDDSLPDVIRELIDTSGLSQRKICKKAGIDQASLSGYIRGIHSPSVRFFCYLLEVLGKELVIADKK